MSVELGNRHRREGSLWRSYADKPLYFSLVMYDKVSCWQGVTNFIRQIIFLSCLNPENHHIFNFGLEQGHKLSQNTLAQSFVLYEVNKPPLLNLWHLAGFLKVVPDLYAGQLQPEQTSHLNTELISLSWSFGLQED